MQAQFFSQQFSAFRAQAFELVYQDYKVDWLNINRFNDIITCVRSVFSFDMYDKDYIETLQVDTRTHLAHVY